MPSSDTRLKCDTKTADDRKGKKKERKISRFFQVLSFIPPSPSPSPFVAVKNRLCRPTTPAQPAPARPKDPGGAQHPMTVEGALSSSSSSSSSSMDKGKVTRRVGGAAERGSPPDATRAANEAPRARSAPLATAPWGCALGALGLSACRPGLEWNKPPPGRGFLRPPDGPAAAFLRRRDRQVGYSSATQ